MMMIAIKKIVFLLFTARVDNQNPFIFFSDIMMRLEELFCADQVVVGDASGSCDYDVFSNI